MYVILYLQSWLTEYLRSSPNTMELLTDRLSTLMKQVSEKQIAELISKDKLQKQRLMERAQKQKMMSYQTRGVLNHSKQFRLQEKSKGSKKPTVTSIWGLSKKPNDAINKAGAICENPKRSGKEEVAFNRFRSAARKTVLINSMKQGRLICTCESLDATCKLHDS